MASDDETQEPLVNEPADMQMDSALLKLAEQRASIDRKRQELNEEARTINANVDKLGINPAAFMFGVRLVKGMTPGERRDYLASVRRVTKVVGERQMELYPEETRRQEKREQDAKDRAAEARTRKGPDADTNPRSDPARGGAGKVKPAAKSKGKRGGKKGGDNVVPLKPKTPAETVAESAAAGDAFLAEQIAKREGETAAGVIHEPGTEPTVEQQELDQGGTVLSDLMPDTAKAAEAAQPQSQSSIAAAKLDQAMHPGTKPN